MNYHEVHAKKLADSATMIGTCSKPCLMPVSCDDLVHGDPLSSSPGDGKQGPSKHSSVKKKKQQDEDGSRSF